VGNWGILLTWFKDHSGLIKIKDKLGKKGWTNNREEQENLGRIYKGIKIWYNDIQKIAHGYINFKDFID
jgi:hypothetical protein